MQLIQSVVGSTVQPSIWFTSLVGEEPWPALRTWSEAISSFVTIGRKMHAEGHRQSQIEFQSLVMVW